MTEHYPRVRIRSDYGLLTIREALRLTFFMRHPHEAISPGVRRALESYLRAIGPDKLTLYADPDMEWEYVEPTDWASVLEKVHDTEYASIQLSGANDNHQAYRFDYHGRFSNNPGPFAKHHPGMVSKVTCLLPTEYMEEHGPGRVRELAMEMASSLPFCTGYTGLAFSYDTGMISAHDEVRRLCFRHPGMDVSNMESISTDIGTQVRGATWLTFLGPPVLEELGGATALRALLQTPGTTVQEMEGQRAVVTLGPWPEAGDLEKGQTLPAYRELARVLEPWLFHEPHSHPSIDMTDTRRWERRFLD